MYCENENSCKKCKDGFSLFNGECLDSTKFVNNLQYYTPDNGINYYTCSSKINNCEECSYNDLSFNKFHCSKCSKGLYLSETYECVINDGSNSNSDPKQSNLLPKRKINKNYYKQNKNY